MVRLNNYDFYPDPQISPSTDIERVKFGDIDVNRLTKKFSISGFLTRGSGEPFTTIMTKKAELETAVVIDGMMDLDFSDGNVYSVKLVSISYPEGTWTNSIEYSIEVETDPEFISDGDAAEIGGKISEDVTVNYVDTDSGKQARFLEKSYTVSGIIIIRDKTSTSLADQRALIKSSLEVATIEDVDGEVSFLGITGRLASLNFQEPSDDDNQQEFSVSIVSEEYKQGEIRTEDYSLNENPEYFGTTDQIIKRTITHTFSGTIWYDENTIPFDPTSGLISGPLGGEYPGTVTYGGKTGRMTARSFSYNRANLEATYSLTLEQVEVVFRQVDKVDISRSVSYIGETEIVQKIAVTYTLGGTITDPDGVSDPSEGLDPDYGQITYRGVTGLLQSSSFNPEEDGTTATYQIVFLYEVEKIAKLSEKMDKSVSIQRGEADNPLKVEYTYRYAGDIESESTAQLTQEQLDALIPTIDTGTNIYYEGNILMSAGYTIDVYGRTASYTIETKSSQVIPGDDEELPEGIVDYEVTTQITPILDQFATHQIIDYGPKYEWIGKAPKQITVSGFYVGETLAYAQAATATLKSEITSTMIPQSMSETENRRKKRVNFTYTVTVPLSPSDIL